MLIDPNPIREVPSIGIPIITVNIRCSKNVAYPAEKKKKKKLSSTNFQIEGGLIKFKLT